MVQLVRCHKQVVFRASEGWRKR